MSLKCRQNYGAEIDILALSTSFRHLFDKPLPTGLVLISVLLRWDFPQWLRGLRTVPVSGRPPGQRCRLIAGSSQVVVVDRGARTDKRRFSLFFSPPAGHTQCRTSVRSPRAANTNTKQGSLIYECCGRIEMGPHLPQFRATSI